MAATPSWWRNPATWTTRVTTALGEPPEPSHGCLVGRILGDRPRAGSRVHQVAEGPVERVWNGDNLEADDEVEAVAG